MSLPCIVPASRLDIFKFYQDEAIYEAIIYKNTILKLAKVVPIQKSDDAYQFAYQLSQEYTTLISPCSLVYRVWVDARCPKDFQLSAKLKALASSC